MAVSIGAFLLAWVLWGEDAKEAEKKQLADSQGAADADSVADNISPTVQIKAAAGGDI
jgi:hypothetical protein